MREWYRRLERFLVYSKYNANSVGTTDLMGTNGRPRHNMGVIIVIL